MALSFTSILVALLGIILLRELPSAAQWVGTAIALVGAVVYFWPLSPMTDELLGLGVAAIGLLANALSSILGRRINRAGVIPPLMVTIVSMGVGAAVLLPVGVTLQGLPRLTLANWATILWLAIVNSAFAFTLWNRTLRTLSAIESSIINNTMLFQIPLLAWLFLGETLTGRQIAGIALAMVGTLVMQLRRPVDYETD